MPRTTRWGTESDERDLTMPRRFPIFQFPNPPLIATIAAAAIARLTQGTLSRTAMQFSRLGLLWWSAEEIMTGANWFRRSLGAAAGAYSLATLKHSRTRRVSPLWAHADDRGTHPSESSQHIR